VLFVYGTLLPGEPRWHHLQPYVHGDGVVDTARGQLFDTGEGYPAAVFGLGSVIVGQVFRLRADSLERALLHLDAVEGAVAGDYRRVRIETNAGNQAWAYEYGGGMTLRAISGGSWQEFLGRV
jgi:gamma-glutamylcyclotransferase (GGCT)/AIG2-like uncharacterized protein YtfP